jgi:hypothetical protein
MSTFSSRAAAAPRSWGRSRPSPRFWPREYGNLDVGLLADSVGAERAFIERSLIQAQREIVVGVTELNAKKVRRLRIGMVLIAIASISITLGLALD